MLTTQIEDLGSDPYDPRKTWQWKHLCFQDWGSGARRIPRVHWAADLLDLVSSRFSGRPCLKETGDEWLRKTPRIFAHVLPCTSANTMQTCLHIRYTYFQFMLGLGVWFRGRFWLACTSHRSESSICNKPKELYVNFPWCPESETHSLANSFNLVFYFGGEEVLGVKSLALSLLGKCPTTLHP